MPIAECGYKNTGQSSAVRKLIHFGPTLGVHVGFDPRFQVGSVVVPNLPADLNPALVDTGAAISCIDDSLIRSLSLPYVDEQLLGAAAGPAKRSMHLAQIRVPSLDFTIYGAFASVDLRGQPHNVLLGRTFLAHFRMVYDGRTGMVAVENESPPAHTFSL